MSNNKKIGEYGENVACDYLLNHKFEIMYKNYFSRFGEIDIIALDAANQDIVFIEVKTRKSFICGRPSEFVSLNKQNKIKKTALDFIEKKKLDNNNFRFDIIEVSGKKIWHIKNAFDF